jgi:hypothetical protein
MKNIDIISIEKISDTNEIMNFINNEWKQNHILSSNKRFFLYEYKNRKALNFIIHKNQSNKIDGILGFLKSSSDKNASIWTTMWKVSKFNGSPMLGIELLNFLKKKGYKSLMSIGINKNTEEIYEYLGFKVGSLDQYFIINEKIDKYQIAIIKKKFKKKKIITNTKKIFKKLNINDLKKNFNFEKYLYYKPYKNFNYFKKRFFDHPIYKYDIYGVFEKSNLSSILVIRVVRYKKSTCMRIIDFYGSDSSFSIHISHLKKTMYENNHEYIDFFSKGLDKKIIFESGFKILNIKNNDVIIPNYFEPFVQNNKKISFFCDKSNFKNIRLFKGDGDQDRPNI